MVILFLSFKNIQMLRKIKLSFSWLLSKIPSVNFKNKNSVRHCSKNCEWRKTTHKFMEEELIPKFHWKHWWILYKDMEIYNLCIKPECYRRTNRYSFQVRMQKKQNSIWLAFVHIFIKIRSRYYFFTAIYIREVL